jgi:hypothetical protein
MPDEDHPDSRQRDWEIAEALGLSQRQVVRIRQQFVCEGEPVLERKVRPSVPGKLDGVAEAKLITICLSDPPDGRDRWTLQLPHEKTNHDALLPPGNRIVPTVAVEPTGLPLQQTPESN